MGHKKTDKIKKKSGAQLYKGTLEVTRSGMGFVIAKALERDDRRRPVRRDPWRHPRHHRPRAARARPPAPGRRAGIEPGTGPPRPRAPRFGDAGAVLDDARDPLGRAPDRPRRRRREGEARIAARSPARGAR